MLSNQLALAYLLTFIFIMFTLVLLSPPTHPLMRQYLTSSTSRFVLIAFLQASVVFIMFGIMVRFGNHYSATTH